MSSTAQVLPTDQEIRAKTCNVFGKRPCNFQIKLCKAQLQRKNIISIAATGSGKTLSYLMTLPFSSNSIVIIVTALVVLGDQFVSESLKAGFAAISVNAENSNEKTFQVRQRILCSNDYGTYTYLGYCSTEVPGCCSHARTSSPARGVLRDSTVGQQSVCLKNPECCFR